MAEINEFQVPICTNDYGDLVYLCHWTNKPVAASDAKVVGGFYPGAKWTFVCAPGYEDARKRSYIAFADSEANCNTCRHLKRLPHEKTASGFLHGECLNTLKRFDVHPYASRFPSYGHMIFHPDDWMGMPCYESRFSLGLEHG